MDNIIFQEFLFTKGVLVSSKPSENAFEVIFTLANKFDIRITEGHEYADEAIINFASDMLGEDVPEPFYRGFPASVKELSPDVLLFDQLLSYVITYGFGNFTEAQHSYFESAFDKIAFKEDTQPKNFVIVTEEKAVELLKDYVEDMLSGSRPLSDTQYNVVLKYITEYNYKVSDCASKNTAIKLLLHSRNMDFAKFLFLSDVLKLVEEMIGYCYTSYSTIYSWPIITYNLNLKKINLRNRDRKFIAAVIDEIFANGYCNVRECFEKKALWCGLLHHIHYKPKTDEAKEFVALMRGKENRSVYSEFERKMNAKEIRAAAECLRKGKGSGALLRNLNYILSRCESEEDIEYIVNSIETTNAIILIQLILQYADYSADKARTFVFTQYNMTKIHTEKPWEQAKRKSALSPATVEMIQSKMLEKLKALLANKLGKVYISPAMYSIALPLQENTSNGGYGILPKGSRLHIEEGKKIRAFTYWEKVNDIDLSVIGLNENGEPTEFSWRTMSANQSQALTFSGDQTSGYNGGSEYFDVDVELFKKNNPKIKYLVFCNNVYYGDNFNQFYCKAGYMLRDINDTGEVFEPKTVASSFTIDCESTFAYLFGIDLETNDFVWLNLSRNGKQRIAGCSSMAFISRYFKATSVLNVGKLFEMLATQLTDSPEEADVAVTDEEIAVSEGTEIIRSYNFEKINALLG
ncbi:MAG: hypothetical protein IIW48_06405 [Clostridia bacterium]|nr:hypothetical protein [Clostridia bacterium]